MVKTISLTANTTQSVTMGGGLHCRVSNRGQTTVYATTGGTLVADADGVYAIPAGTSRLVRNLTTLFGGSNVLKLRAAAACKVEVEDVETLNFSVPSGSGAPEGAWETLDSMADGRYDGCDLTDAFAAEIAASPYNGDPWAWVQARIQAGAYAGLHIGDWIPFSMGGKTYRAQIAGIDTYKGAGDVVIGHHMDFISREIVPTFHAMNPKAFNNGVIPTAVCSGTGSQKTFVLSHNMAGIAEVLVDNVAVTDYTYDAETQTLTCSVAPAAGTGNVKISGTGSKHPWLASDLYLWLNGLSGRVKVYPMSRTIFEFQFQKPDNLWYNTIALPSGRTGQR